MIEKKIFDQRCKDAETDRHEGFLKQAISMVFDRENALRQKLVVSSNLTTKSFALACKYGRKWRLLAAKGIKHPLPAMIKPVLERCDGPISVMHTLKKRPAPRNPEFWFDSDACKFVPYDMMTRRSGIHARDVIDSEQYPHYISISESRYTEKANYERPELVQSNQSPTFDAPASTLERIEQFPFRSDFSRSTSRLSYSSLDIWAGNPDEIEGIKARLEAQKQLKQIMFAKQQLCATLKTYIADYSNGISANLPEDFDIIQAIDATKILSSDITAYESETTIRNQEVVNMKLRISNLIEHVNREDLIGFRPTANC